MAASAAYRKSNSSVWLVIALAAVALIAGWGLKSFTEGRTRAVSSGGVTASLPDRWLVDAASAGPLGGSSDPTHVFTSWDPLDPSTRYSVSLLPAGDDTDLASFATLRNLQRAQTLSSYRVLEQTPVTLKGRDGYKVTFAFVDSSAMNQAPTVFQGVDYYFGEGGQVLVATLETSHDFDSVVTRFQDFAAGVHLGE